LNKTSQSANSEAQTTCTKPLNLHSDIGQAMILCSI
jgi:hypothetical protein